VEQEIMIGGDRLQSAVVLDCVTSAVHITAPCLAQATVLSSNPVRFPDCRPKHGVP
jgi:hypothetical protein